MGLKEQVEVVQVRKGSGECIIHTMSYFHPRSRHLKIHFTNKRKKVRETTGHGTVIHWQAKKLEFNSYHPTPRLTKLFPSLRMPPTDLSDGDGRRWWEGRMESTQGLL